MSQPQAPASGVAVWLRPVQFDDEEFLLSVYASTRAEEMKLVPWDEAQREAFIKMQFTAQREHYQAEFPTATHHVIMRQAQPVGRIYLYRGPKEIRILDITVLPEYRNAGIATPLIQELLAEAAQTNRSVGIYVEQNSPAIRLFGRLGFEIIEESDFNIRMRARAGV